MGRNKEGAIVELDQVGNAEGCPITRLREFQVHFRFTNEGKLEFESFGEGTSELLLTLAYPILVQALDKVYEEMDRDQEAFTTEQQARIQAAIEQERQRVRIKPEDIAEPETEMGRDIQKQTGMASPLINRIVQQTTKEMLKDFKRRGQPY